MARARDNADLLSGGKTIEMEPGKTSGLSVLDYAGKEIFNIKENGEIYQEHRDVEDETKSGVILLSESGGVRVTYDGALEITNDGGINWFPCCYAIEEPPDETEDGEEPEEPEEPEEEVIPIKEYSFEASYEASKLISGNVYAHFYINPITKRLFSCGFVGGRTYNHLSISAANYASVGNADYKDKFSEITPFGELPSTYAAKMVRTQEYASNGTFIILEDGRLFSIGSYSRYGEARGLVSGGKQPPRWEQESNRFSDWIYLAVGNGHSLGIRSNGSLWHTVSRTHPYWGNFIGSKFEPITSFPGGHAAAFKGAWKMVSAQPGYRTSLAYGIKQDGTLYRMNYVTNRHYPASKGGGIYITKISGAKNWLYVSAAQRHMVALNDKGEMWGLGNHTANGTYKDSHASCLAGGSSKKANVAGLIQIGDENDWIFCDGSLGKTIGIKKDGTLWNAGLNQYFELGIGGRYRNSAGYKINTPRAVIGDFVTSGYLGSTATLHQEGTFRTDWLAVCGTDSSMLALTDKYVLHACGSNNVKTGYRLAIRGRPGSKIGLAKSVLSMDYFQPCVYGETKYPGGGKIPAPSPPTTPPSPVVKYDCTWAGPAPHPPTTSDCYKNAHGIPLSPVKYNCTWAGPAPHPPITSDCYKNAHGIS